MMKFVGTTLVLLGFVGMAGFGFLAMNPQGDMHGCIAALTRGVQCPAESDSFSSLAFHAGVIKSFSTATVGAGLFAMLLLLVVLALAFANKRGEGTALPFLTLLFLHKQETRVFASPLAQRILHWFSLHENSPAFT